MVDPYYGTLCITYKYNKSSIVSHKHLQATLLNFKELCGEYTFLYYIINRTRTHKTKHLYVCVYTYTVDPHYSQISYLCICLPAKFVIPKSVLCHFCGQSQTVIGTKWQKNLSCHM